MTNISSSSALMIFIKNAEKGKVKTRLAATVGNDKALAIYKALLDHTRQVALSIKTNRLLFYSNAINQTDQWSGDAFKKHLQRGQDLGERISSAFALAFKKHNKVVIIGSDCASLSAQIVEESFNQLDSHDFVIGPATDGGYYLLGMSALQPSVFENIEWSTEKVFPATIKAITDLGLSYALLPELSDIDFEEDWERWGWELPGD